MTDFSVRGANVVVVGAARSGVGAAQLLVARGARVTLTEQRTEVGLDVRRLTGDGVALELGGHRIETLAGADLIVLSPGVPPAQPVLNAARERGVPIISEVELASRWVRGRIVAITGTKGKSTTTVLLGRMLEAAGCLAFVGGNVGTALSTQIEKSTPEAIHVVEVSSFQLEMTTTFRPWISVFLNLYTDHLDRHGDADSYAAAKARIFANQEPTETLVVNADDPEVLRLARESRATRLDYAVNAQLDDGVVVSQDAIIRRTGAGFEPLVPLSAVHLLGRHLLSDVVAASAVAHRVGLAPDDMTSAVDCFLGLEHVLEDVGKVSGVNFINDSKATNVESTRRALESCEGRLVVLMGGRFKGGRLQALSSELASRAAAVVAVGEARDQIRDEFGPIVQVVGADSLGEAVQIAYGLAPHGGTVLLSPACSSLDMFQDYAERGRAFKRAVARLREEVVGTREQ